MKKYLRPFITLQIISSGILSAQSIINAYARVTNIATSKQLTVSNVNISYHTFNVGEKVIVMQMQDNVIGANTGNNNSFGNLNAISNTGVYEVGTISALSPAAGTPTLITLSTNLVNTYNINTNASVQVISYRNLGATYTTTNSITGLAWDGNVGGVIALEVGGVLTLNHSITADAIGFRGGAMSSSADETCDNTTYRTNSNLKAYKGEGIYKSTTANQTNGRGKILNGGGGGGENNSGGGGGGNYTAGGNGGLGWQCTAANSGYGIGGLSLSGNISVNRIFMGGGGGGGQQNNGVGTDGGNGGGIILLKAGTIKTNTVCSSPIRITANGATAANSANDGSGGGGAGGSMILQVNTFSITATCQLTVSASGGDGGSVTDPNSHGGGGGGGGQGVIFYSISQPTVNTTTAVNNGNGGANNSSGSSSASPGSGTNNSGIFTATGPLPIQLIHFDGYAADQFNRLIWTTMTEVNNDYFTLEKSQDGSIFTQVIDIDGAGNSSEKKNYQYDDYAPYTGINYYRLKQTDFNKTVHYSPVIAITYVKTTALTVFPNPLLKDHTLYISFGRKAFTHATVNITEVNGNPLYEESFQNPGEKNTLEIPNIGFAPGLYIVHITDDYTNCNLKLIIQ